MISMIKPVSRDILSKRGYELIVKDWIEGNIPCVLLYKDGKLDIYPIEDYTCYEFTMLQSDASYKSPWIPIRFGGYLEMEECMDEIMREGLWALSAASGGVA